MRSSSWVSILSDNFKSNPVGCLTRWQGKCGLLIGLSQLYGWGLPTFCQTHIVFSAPPPLTTPSGCHRSFAEAWISRSSETAVGLLLSSWPTVGHSRQSYNMPSFSLLLLLISCPLAPSLPHWCRQRLAHSSHTPRPANHLNSCQFGSGPGPCGGEVCLKGPGEVCGGARARYGNCAEGLLCSDCNR